MSARAIPAPAADNTTPAVDKVVQDIADYVHDYQIDSPLAVSNSPPQPFPCTVRERQLSSSSSVF